MPLLHVALQDGFIDDTVAIEVNGEEVFRREHVRTRPQLGVAAAHEMTIDEGPLSVTIALPDRQLTRSLTLTATGDTYLGASIEGEEIRFKQSPQPFGYV